jgi:hypothetical protein
MLLCPARHTIDGVAHAFIVDHRTRIPAEELVNLGPDQE